MLSFDDINKIEYYVNQCEVYNLNVRQLRNEIKNKLVDNEIYSKVKDYSKERHKVITYFEIGKLLNDAGGKYGDNIIDEYSKKLVVEVGKKYNRRTLFRMKQFYSMFSDEKVSQLATQLSWSHYIELLPLKNIDEIR